jgi:hypothetical protein
MDRLVLEIHRFAGAFTRAAAEESLARIVEMLEDDDDPALEAEYALRWHGVDPDRRFWLK